MRAAEALTPITLFIREKETMPDLSQQMEEEPPVNKAVDDVIAIAGGDPEQEAMILHAMMWICCERMAQVVGRGRCRDHLRSLDNFVRDAQPGRPSSSYLTS